jgi:hypothetical protein
VEDHVRILCGLFQKDLSCRAIRPRSSRANKKPIIFARIDLGFFLSGSGPAGTGKGGLQVEEDFQREDWILDRPHLLA